ncbi:ATPase family protein associated with various cellular activities (AAA) [Krasilnikovia cinnamomea]|uniref:ATPase family protein associated with various cellular activities (AAA) n=1 Tax=Krasilnikovia cinnamomea TaxID=349313 RepID=A0A4Q7ZE37_9ACTN|nr:ATP-binding protein [Krasilnikovia cinnamomea]RZU48491.1 ATPase family protein associated with various cellular activities (AAA) [Krasilnikovia cinnamomea]
MAAPAEPWITLADTLLQREALVCRLADGRPPRDFAGLYVGDEEVERVLAGLPGLDGPGPARVAAVRAGSATGVGRAREAFRAALTGTSRLAALARAAHLSTAEAEVLALVVAVELSPARQRLVAYLQDSVQLPRLTLATLAQIFADDPGHPAERALAPGAGPRRAALARLGGDGPWATLVAEPAARLVWHLRGDASPDPALPPGTVRIPGDAPQRPGGLLLVHGGDRESRLRAVRAHWPGAGLLVCPPPEAAAGWEAVVREATIGNLVVVLELTAPLSAAARDAVSHGAHLDWVLSSAGEQPLEAVPDRPWREIRVGDGEADADDWQRVLGRAPDPAYRLSREQLRLVAAAASADSGQVAPAVRRLAGGHLDGVAVRIRPRRGWDDLILPADETGQLHELSARHLGRDTVYGRWRFSPVPSTGVVALFAGPSGTGKTLAAEVVAGELGLDLYKVDLSAVVSKYIGETEKNLERIFGAAAAGDLVLFFDEADALFGKRSEVSDAHDRYANIEVAYLLQRLETYDGLVVLATNLQRNIDPAFLRRISVAIDFVAPEEPQRRAIWARAFPPTAPLCDLDLDFLARQFKVTGGVISNAALGAAFLAAAEDSPITMRHAVLSMKREFQKLGRLRTEKEFDRYFDLVNRDADAAPAR